MLNYFKVFRLRKFAMGEEKQLPEQRLVFFDDASPDSVEKAATAARAHRDTMLKKYEAVRIAIWRSVAGVRTYQIGFFGGGGL